ncbi:pentapeptide repeat-containing protein [Streptomyces sp. RKAG290]|uniref:pentapeptide repeat-containing protein n=1 Tax=Streptomyces sp. RKAG290 TaxID=2888348 RepID=UPI002033F86D|nr:pentapeptide repeat-containing protein [Streptomyces sp. RKAG290]MCM2416101.1 pentapeptide repeat-containing protein [Streptomyces sp. RKAG290]
MTATDANLDVPHWPHCRYGATSDDSGCWGRLVEPYTACLAHLCDADRSGYLTGLQPGAHLDHRGTPISEELLRDLLGAVTSPESSGARIGQARFERARFSGNADFGGADIAEGSLRVVINSVVFRSSGQDLTTAGTYTEMASLLVEPALLGLAVLAVRGRVKR